MRPKSPRPTPRSACATVTFATTLAALIAPIVAGMPAAASTGSQIKSEEAFLQGTYVEVGIRKNGAFGAGGSVPTDGVTFHPQEGTKLGFVVDRDKDGWGTGPIDGDFFVPGSPYEGWGISVGANTAFNTDGGTGIAGSLGSLSTSSGVQSVTWTADAAYQGIDVTQVYEVPDSDQLLRMRVTLTNSTGAAIDDIYYSRGVDPDNSNDADTFTSTNTVVAQPGDGGAAIVRAVFSEGAQFALFSADSRARAARSTSGFPRTYTIPDAWAGSSQFAVEVDSSDTRDAGMNLTVKIGTLAAGASTTFTLSYLLSAEAVDEAVSEASAPAPAPSAPEPAPAQNPAGGLPQESLGSTSGSVGSDVVPPLPSIPTPGTAEFRVGQVNTRIDVTTSGAGRVDGSDDAPVLRATRDRVATISGGGMRPNEVAEVWLPLPDGASRRVALLRVAADGTFDGALPFTGELDGQGPLPIGDRTLQLYGVDESGQLTVLNVGVRIEQPGPLAPEPERTPGAPPTLTPGQTLVTNAGLLEPVTVTPIPGARTTRVEGSGWLMEIDVPEGEVAGELGAPVIRVAAGDDTEVRGTGFMPSTRAYVWLMSDPTFLGEVTVDADGKFEGEVPLAGIAPGEHTLQLSGVGTDGYVRAANLGVIVTGQTVPSRIPAGGGQDPAGPLPLVLTLALGAAGSVLLRRRQAT